MRERIDELELRFEQLTILIFGAGRRDLTAERDRVQSEIDRLGVVLDELECADL